MSECECGNAKSERAQACERCTFLDGSKGQGRVISILRAEGGPMDTYEIARLSGCGPTSITHMMKHMIRKRRVPDDLSDERTTYYLVSP